MFGIGLLVLVLVCGLDAWVVCLLLNSCLESCFAIFWFVWLLFGLLWVDFTCWILLTWWILTTYVGCVYGLTVGLGGVLHGDLICLGLFLNLGCWLYVWFVEDFFCAFIYWLLSLVDLIGLLTAWFTVFIWLLIWGNCWLLLFMDSWSLWFCCIGDLSGCVICLVYCLLLIGTLCLGLVDRFAFAFMLYVDILLWFAWWMICCWIFGWKFVVSECVDLWYYCGLFCRFWCG